MSFEKIFGSKPFYCPSGCQTPQGNKVTMILIDEERYDILSQTSYEEYWICKMCRRWSGNAQE